ncbi:MAG: DUF4956 domain-containing protein [Bacilli bacterium]|nr:DUF4956 domain-containing protein [Bacilli bacterium]
MFTSIFDSSTSLSLGSIMLCFLTSIILGMVIAITHIKTSEGSKNFATTLVVLPALVQVVMIMVNGNLGTSVAVLGAFGLVRFRSIPGTSKEIMFIFLSMAIGLSVGMGQILFAIITTIIICILLVVLSVSNFGKTKSNYKYLKITIPENLDYTDVFIDVFKTFTSEAVLEKSKTTNLGSMFELTYKIKLLPQANEKEFIDNLRVKNGNLSISLSERVIMQEL